jgi:hypothetical protein
MENYNPQSSAKDPQLWAIAKRRASFKRHLGTYIIIIGFLWVLWLFTGNNSSTGDSRYPWPIWATGGWGIGLLFHYLSAYVSPGQNSAEKEYEKLTRNKK